MYRYDTIIQLHETDAAGLLFFSNQFKIMHDAYELLLEELGFSFAELIRNKSFFLPIVHAEADYKRPLFVGDRIVVEVSVEHIGTTSFIFSYNLWSDKKELVGTGRTVHVTMDKKKKEKIPLPEDLRSAISSFANSKK